ncbi:LOW QUALITY PROTEIN: hypothetical protein Cgig2_027419 [Carnegiea gigantea]|uniref:Peptidase A2 domain-containing protein n=1 Tax=Carnegiea gigantea TaxID=171969 RepID=A0A9Q1GUW7_9CARY|nr:LOW QUALITY PROTEIN: hypothetical protein Cgig2_027419 [Carnegiea gigantea]
MVFDGKKAWRFTSPHNDPLVVEMKIASAIRILVDMGNSVEIITCDCLKKLTHPGRHIIPLVHPILGFGGQEVNPVGMIHLPLRFGDKLKSRNLEVDFLVVDVPTAYNVILGCLTLHRKEKRTKKKEKEGALHIGLFTVLTTLIFRSLGISIQGVIHLIPCLITLTRRRNKLHLFEVSALVLGPLALVNVVEVGLEVAVFLKFLGQRHQDLAYLHGPADGLAPGLGPASQPPRSPQPWPLKAPPPAGAAGLFSRPLERLRRWYQVANPSSIRHSVAALTPRANASAIVISSSVILGGSEVPETAKSQDLTKSLTNSWMSENLAVGSAMMKLVDGCWVLMGEPVPRGGLVGSHVPSMGRGRRHGLIRAALDSLALVNQ